MKEGRKERMEDRGKEGKSKEKKRGKLNERKTMKRKKRRKQKKEKRNQVFGIWSMTRHVKVCFFSSLKLSGPVLSGFLGVT